MQTDWPCAALEDFINGPLGEPKAFAKKVLAFRRKWNLN